MIATWKQTILAAVLVTLLSSCVRNLAKYLPAQETWKDRLCSVHEGMTESQVSALLGEPEEVRRKGENGIVEEAYRWVYGARLEGEFPRVGSVIFGTNHTVLYSDCPTRPSTQFPYTRVPPVPFSESPQSSPAGMRCTIDSVFRRPDFYNYPYIRVSIRNAGRSEFRYTNDHTGIRFSLILEVYDADKVLVLQELLFHFHSPVQVFHPEQQPVMVVAPGAQKSEDVPLWWRGVNDGRLPPGTYYVRVAFPFEDHKFFGSNLAKWEVSERKDQP